MKSHENRVAVVTGAARGIGQEIAIRLADRGAILVLIDMEEPQETAERIGGDVLTLVGDVGIEENWTRFAASVTQRHGRADIVVNNAGIYPFAEIDTLTAEIWRHTFAVNLDSQFYSAKAFVPLMRLNNWGRFVNLGSSSIGTCQIGLSHYMASKMGVIGFVRGLANDLGADGITVNAILPSITRTPGTSMLSDEVLELAWKNQSIKRFAGPEDIAGPVLFLTSDDAAFVTGQALVVDGGMYKIS